MKYRNPYDLDVVESILFNRKIILNKKFLNRLYTEWCNWLIGRAKTCRKGVYLELGSGGDFLKKMFLEVVTSDVLDLPIVDIVCNAEQLPFEDNSLACIT
jgi:hypothetical protein